MVLGILRITVSTRKWPYSLIVLPYGFPIICTGHLRSEAKQNELVFYINLQHIQSGTMKSTKNRHFRHRFREESWRNEWILANGNQTYLRQMQK